MRSVLRRAPTFQHRLWLGTLPKRRSGLHEWVGGVCWCGRPTGLLGLIGVHPVGLTGAQLVACVLCCHKHNTLWNKRRAVGWSGCRPPALTLQFDLLPLLAG